MESLLKLAPPAHILKFSSYYAGHTLNLTSAELNTHYALLCKRFCTISFDDQAKLWKYIMTQNQDTGGWMKQMSNRERRE